jgi:glycosyltransferase involved in cell wall biosynthesis
MCIEAMSAGCPVIYTKRSVGPEIVKDEESGVLIDPDDIQGIAGAIIRLADNEGLRNSFAGRALEDVRNKFNIKNSALMHIAFYRQVISSFMATNNATN